MIASAHRLHPTSSPFSWSYLCRPGETKTALDGLAQSGCSPGRSPGPADGIDTRRTRRIGSSGTGASGQRRHPGSRERSVISLSVEHVLVDAERVLLLDPVRRLDRHRNEYILVDAIITLTPWFCIMKRGRYRTALWEM